MVAAVAAGGHGYIYCLRYSAFINVGVRFAPRLQRERMLSLTPADDRAAVDAIAEEQCGD